MDFSQFQLNKLGSLFTTSWGIVVVAMFILLLLSTAVLRPARWWALTFLLYAVTMGVPVTRIKYFSPVEEFAEFTRPMCAALLAALIVPTIRSDRGWRSRTFMGSLFLYFIFEIVVSMRNFSGGSFDRGYFGIINFAMIFLTLGVGLSRWLQSLKDVHSVLRCMVWAGMLTILGTVIQLGINPNAVIWNHRLHGTTDNANFLGTLLAITLLPTAFMATRSGANLIGRIFYLSIIALSGVMIAWTGSRTAALITLCGLAFFFRKRLGRLVLFGIIACGMGLMIWNYYSPEQSATTGRLFEATNTRTEVWSTMLGEFISNPLFGSSAADSVGSENSYLYAARTTGVIGLIPFLIGLWLIVKSIRNVSKQLPPHGPYRDLADLIGAGIFSLLIGAFFEGYLCAFYSIPVIAIYIYCALIGFLQDSVAQAGSLVSYNLEMEDFYEQGGYEQPSAAPAY